jgi:hypothetical protein
MGINGRQYDHEDCRIMLPSGLAFGIQELNYEDGQEVEARYGRGATPRGYGRKNYEASGSMTLDRDQFEPFKLALKLSAGANGGFLDHKPFTVISSYANEDQGTITDTLPNVKVTKLSAGYKQGEANDNQVSIDFTILSPIKWNGVAAKKG